MNRERSKSISEFLVGKGKVVLESNGDQEGYMEIGSMPTGSSVG